MPDASRPVSDLTDDQIRKRLRVPVQEAAHLLGISPEAVRSRLYRGTLDKETGTDGTVYVRLHADQLRHGDEQRVDQTQPSTELVRELRARVEDLREQLAEEREARRRADTIIAQLARANEEQSRTIRELEAPSEPPSEARESPQTVGDEPERAEPPSATGGAQEGTERPQQRRGWLAPVDKLPWWQYVLGSLFVFLAAIPSVAAGLAVGSMNRRGGIWVLAPLGILLVGTWLLPGILGFWVGFRLKKPRFWSQMIAFGALIGAAPMLGIVVSGVAYERISAGTSIVVGLGDVIGGAGLPILIVGSYFPAWLLYVSAAFIGNAWQRRRSGRISGIIPASPISRSTRGTAQQTRKDLTPTQQAILGWGGAIISAFITLVGTIITVRSGG